ncbi:F-actin-capping protein subunit alpha [Microbotryomycetes sp. JL201]|nr:F-actin-capping protein subunit alpha [Microbotryomycetes sp. JL201]
MASVEQKISLASKLILQSPPGEENDVFNDLRVIVNDDDKLERGILPALAQYNKEQYIVVAAASARSEPRKTLITDASQLKGATLQQHGRHIDPETKQSFLFDDMKLVSATASDEQPLSVDAETERLRSSIAEVLSAYVSNHYSDGVSSVYALEDPKYSPEQHVGDASNAEQRVRGASNAAVAIDQEAVRQAAEHGLSDSAKEDPVQERAEEDAEQKSAPDPDALEQQTKGAQTEKPLDPSLAADEADAEEHGAPVVTADYQATQAVSAGVDVAPAEESENVSVGPEPAKARPSRVFGLYLVGNKYNPANYWTGRWRARYIADFEKQTLEGKASVNVHYYEQGNVQLTTEMTSSQQLSSNEPSSEELVALVKSSESSFAAQLSDAYMSLSDDMFKSLRRTLPRSKAKLSWEKMVVYKAGQSLRAGESVKS